MSLESIEHLLNIRLIFNKINPAKPGVVINTANIVFVLKGSMRLTRGGVNRLTTNFTSFLF